MRSTEKNFNQNSALEAGVCYDMIFERLSPVDPGISSGVTGLYPSPGYTHPVTRAIEVSQAVCKAGFRSKPFLVDLIIHHPSSSSHTAQVFLSFFLVHIAHHIYLYSVYANAIFTSFHLSISTSLSHFLFHISLVSARRANLE